jgi:hypothetical protein
MADFLSEIEKALKGAMNQLSPEERKISSKTNVKKMAQKGIEARNTKAQAYIDKKAAQKAPSMAAKAGQMTAQAERAASEGAKKLAARVASTAAEAAPKIVSAAKAAGRAAPLVAAAIETVRTGKLLADEDYRKENEAAYEDLAEKNFLQRAVEGGLGGVTSIYAAGKNIDDTVGAYTRAAQRDMAFQNKQKELIARGILDKDGRPIRREEAAPAPEFDGGAWSRALIDAPPVQPEKTAPRESDAPAAYEDIETGNAPKAIIVDESETQAPEISEDRMSALFRKTMGTAFDPKSKMDASKMNQLREFVSGNSDLLNKSDTKIALDYYRTLK